MPLIWSRIRSFGWRAKKSICLYNIRVYLECRLNAVLTYPLDTQKYRWSLKIGHRIQNWKDIFAKSSYAIISGQVKDDGLNFWYILENFLSFKISYLLSKSALYQNFDFLDEHPGLYNIF